ncbi:MAG: peptide-methionine (S)-S-oxide reductase MsrA [Defluviitaleaceae bacterium]|nr:peptide-methionine (S)-S-oxide reductase MsrA [Defluviitaleaceae bacterium]
MQKEIYLAGGCFWGVEKYLAMMPGIMATEVGYANGITQNPTYEDVCSGTTGFAEAVRITYNAAQTNLDTLLAHFYEIINPTTLNRQGPDIGSQYRTGIYYTDPSEAETIASSLANLQKAYDMPIVTENLPLESYYKAEEYHQKYLDKNPGGYCHIPEHKYEEAKNAVK